MVSVALVETIRARRDELAAQMEAGKQEYARIEALLAELRRAIDAMAGGVQELDALLEDATASPPPPASAAPPSQ